MGPVERGSETQLKPSLAQNELKLEQNCCSCRSVGANFLHGEAVTRAQLGPATDAVRFGKKLSYLE